MRSCRAIPMVLVALFLTGCATVPDSVKLAVQKEGEAIEAFAEDYEFALQTFADELNRQIKEQIALIFELEMKKAELAGTALSTDDIITLRNQGSDKEAQLLNDIWGKLDEFKQSENLAILRTLHTKVSQYVEADGVSSEGLDNILGLVESVLGDQ